MKLAFLFALCLLSCTSPTPDPGMTTGTNETPGVSKNAFLALGDSYTIGESVGEADRWPVQLAGLLRKDSVDVANPDIIARTGWTTAELQDEIKRSGNQKTYGLISLMIGVNNQYRGQNQDRYRTEFAALLQTAINFAGGKATHVFVLSTPDWGQSPYAAGRDKAQIAREIDQFNAIARDECQKAGIAFVDVTPLTRAAAGDASQFASDGLHYSGKQMQQWAATALLVVKELLKK